MKLRVLVAGGIYDKPAEYRAAHRITPETNLAAGLAEEGFHVTVQGLSEPLRAERFDLVHVHHFGRAAVCALTRPRGCRFVFTSHDGFLFGDAGRDRRRGTLHSMVLRGADGLVALSVRERWLLTSQYRVRDERVDVIPNGIPELFDAPPREPETAPRQNKDLLFVGQLQRFKGLDYLFEAMPKVRAGHPGVRLRLCYQSDGMLDFYRRRAAEIGIADCVLFEGPRSPEQLAELYRSCAVFVHPSLFECLSTVISEAMLSAACVIATDVGGVREQLDSECGVIVPPRDSEALTAAICGALGSPARRALLGAAARIKARQRFTIPTMIRRHVHLYERVLNAQPVARPLFSSLLADGMNVCLKFL
jgi:glycosyltransferase involved in cell wall biosynthesis